MAAETVLVTGPSSGIGLELARLFAADGCGLVLVARREERLRELATELSARHAVAVQVLARDLADPDAPGEVVASLAAEGIEVDILVNNAGFGARGAVADLGLERQLEMVRVNVLALTELTRRLLPGMLERRRGGVLNVASTAAFQPGPYMSVYYATKAYVLAFSEGLREEVRGSGLRVTCLAPGPTATGFAEEADMEGSLLFRLGAMTAERVARNGHRGFRAGRALVVPGLTNKLGVLSVRLAPRALVRKVTEALQRP